MADLLKILKERQTHVNLRQPAVAENKTAVPPVQSEILLTTKGHREITGPSFQRDQTQSIAAPNCSKTTRWGIPIADKWDANDLVFQRDPAECDCYRNGVLRCGTPCVWAWPPGAKIGDKPVSLVGGDG